jgi:hypothetical protein
LFRQQFFDVLNIIIEEERGENMVNNPHITLLAGLFILFDPFLMISAAHALIAATENI